MYPYSVYSKGFDLNTLLTGAEQGVLIQVLVDQNGNFLWGLS